MATRKGARRSNLGSPAKVHQERLHTTADIATQAAKAAVRHSEDGRCRLAVGYLTDAADAVGRGAAHLSSWDPPMNSIRKGTPAFRAYMYYQRAQETLRQATATFKRSCVRK